MQSDTNKTENALFRAYTTVTLGNGHILRFWMDIWLRGRSPKELAPTLIRLAWRKNHTVAYGLQGSAWKPGLQRISTRAQIEEFITLWHLVTPIQLLELPNTITWHFMANDIYLFLQLRISHPVHGHTS
jgi:hypothetical protein